MPNLVLSERSARCQWIRVDATNSYSPMSLISLLFLCWLRRSIIRLVVSGKETPLIMDTGASCCISPRRSDFVTYLKSQVKIKDLSSSNSVAGKE